MEFNKEKEKSIFVKSKSLMIFSDEARYCWTHAISQRKLDKLEN